MYVVYIDRIHLSDIYTTNDSANNMYILVNNLKYYYKSKNTYNNINIIYIFLYSFIYIYIYIYIYLFNYNFLYYYNKSFQSLTRKTLNSLIFIKITDICMFPSWEHTYIFTYDLEFVLKEF